MGVGRLRAAAVVIIAVVLTSSACTGHGRSAATANAIAPASPHRTGPNQTTASPIVARMSYPLWSDGWTPEEPGNAASETGVFHATLIDGHACASIGGGPTRWPQGWSVRFNPTELVDAAGHLVAREGDELAAGGGFGLRATASSPCGPVGAGIWSVAIRVTKA
jgi:hypothetical protein